LIKLAEKEIEESPTMPMKPKKPGLLSEEDDDIDFEEIESASKDRGDNDDDNPDEEEDPGVKELELYYHDLEKYGDDLKEYMADMVKYNKKLEVIVRDKTLAVLFLLGCDRRRFGSLLDELKVGYVKGRDEYPSNVYEAVRYLTKEDHLPKHGKTGRGRRKERNGGQSSYSFAQADMEGVKGTDGNLYPTIECFKCNKYGHYARQCPKSGVQLAQVAVHDPRDFGLMFSQTNGKRVDMEVFLKNHLCCDSASTHHGFNDMSLLTDIETAAYLLRSVSNGGVRVIDRKGTFKDIPNVWLDEGSLANILSLSLLEEQ
jgi:hypothetical protein